MAHFLRNTAFREDDWCELFNKLVLSLVLSREKPSDSQRFNQPEMIGEIDLTTFDSLAFSSMLSLVVIQFAEGDEETRNSIRGRLASLLDESRELRKVES